MQLERLTECEELVMNIIWESEEELSLLEIQKRTNDKYHKNWKPQTVSTFLARLVRKGYLSSYREGRLFYYKILVPVSEYKGQAASDFLKFWNHDNADEFLCALAGARPIRQDEIMRIMSRINRNMDYKRLADVIRRFANVELLACEIESLVDSPEIGNIDDLTEFLEDELDYARE